MAPSDDDIPDLFPPGPGAVPRSSSQGGTAPRVSRDSGGLRTKSPAPVAHRASGSAPPLGFVDPEPRPSRPVPGPESGLELESIEEAPFLSEKSTMIAGTSDELEFDPTSIPPPDFEEARSQGARVEVRQDAALLLDLGLAPESPEPRAARSSRPPSIRPPRTDASRGASLGPPSLDVPSLDVPAPEFTAHRVPEPKSAPPEANSSSKRGLLNAGFAAFPGMGNEVDLGEGLDDLDFGGAAAAQLNVGVEEREEGDDVPWPVARTPVGDELAVSAREAEQLSGFGVPPKAFIEAPLYALRVYRALGSLQENLNDAHKRLREVEEARDELLAELAVEKRGELQNSDRFAPLYAELEKREQAIKLRKRDLEMADVEGAQALRDVQAEIDTQSAERLVRTRVRDEKRVVMEEAERSLKRKQAALRRIQIEWRNVEARAAKTAGPEMPDELDAQLDALEQQQVQAKAALDYAIKQFKEVKNQLAERENDVRVAAAEVQRAEGKKEGLLIANEGDIAERSRALDRVLLEKRQLLSDVGRAIIDLRGQVPVTPAVRSNLLAADERVATAARQFETLRMALSSMDRDAYSTGRAVWVVGLLVLLVLLALSAV